MRWSQIGCSATQLWSVGEDEGNHTNLPLWPQVRVASCTFCERN